MVEPRRVILERKYTPEQISEACEKAANVLDYDFEKKNTIRIAYSLNGAAQMDEIPGYEITIRGKIRSNPGPEEMRKRFFGAKINGFGNGESQQDYFYISPSQSLTHFRESLAIEFLGEVAKGLEKIA